MPPRSSPSAHRALPSVLAAALAASMPLSLALTGCSEDSDSTSGSIHPLDTAILFPLPETAAQDRLLRFDAAGEQGRLLPSYATGQLPALNSGRNVELWPLLRVVAANVDPCFPSGVEGKVDEQGVSQCRKQLRLIFQPVRDDGAGKLTTDDVSVHSFYEMDAGTFAELVDDLIAARGDASLGDGAIDVHPVLIAEGSGGAYQTELQRIFLRYAGASTLVKVTFSGLRGGGIGWQMGAVDFVGTVPTDATIAATTVIREEMINNGAAAGDFNASVDPSTEFSRGLGVLLSSAAARAASDAEVRAAYREALRIDNPETELHPGTVDCSSCHLATPTRLWAERNRGLRAADFEEAYVNPRWNLENRGETQENTQSTRCFGYFGRSVALSQRTINEAAAVADFINTRILGEAL
jgi:hypothetical protein